MSRRRTPAERALLDYLRADAWRFDEFERIEAKYLRCVVRDESFTPFELNVLYEMLALSPVIRKLFGATGNEEKDLPHWLHTIIPSAGAMRAFKLPTLPFQLIVSVATLMVNDPRSHEMSDGTVLTPEDAEPLAAQGVIELWRDLTRNLRQTWGGWSLPEALPTMMGNAMAHSARSGIPAGGQAVITLACETLMRMTWLYECEQMDALAFGPVSDRRLPTNPEECVITLRRFAEQQPELRKVPAFVHVAPKLPDAWLRPREYGRISFLPSDREQTLQVIRDAVANRHYLHDHVAVIEVDRKPIKMVVLAPEHRERLNHMTYLNAMVVHEKGTFVVEVMVRTDPDDPQGVTCGLLLPFGSTAWRGLSEDGREEHMALQRANELAPLPADGSILSLVVAAWRDLIVANVREEQYEATTIREEKQPKGRRAERKAKRGHAKVVRYLPRMVVVRRAEESERLERTGSTRQLRRAFRVGTFARLLGEGRKRSLEATEFAQEIGMPLRDDQTIVRPHIRGGTPEEREALLAQDDVRLWRSWAAVDLLFATRVS